MKKNIWKKIQELEIELYDCRFRFTFGLIIRRS